MAFRVPSDDPIEPISATFASIGMALWRPRWLKLLLFPPVSTIVFLVRRTLEPDGVVILLIAADIQIDS